MKPCARDCAAHSALTRAARRAPRGAQIIACDVINPDHINVKFDTIGGLEDIKKALVRPVALRRCFARRAHASRRAAQYDLVILPLVRPELFERGRLLKPTKVRPRSSPGG